jgi:hypothetical protein
MCCNSLCNLPCTLTQRPVETLVFSGEMEIQMADTRNGLRDYFLKRKAEEEQQLKDALKLGFRLKRVAVGGIDVDVTDQYYADLRRSIEEYQRAADMLSDDPPSLGGQSGFKIK